MSWRFGSIVAVAGAIAGGGASVAAADVSVTDASVTEGNSGFVNMTFTLTSSTGGDSGSYSTSDGTAVAPGDYTPTSGFFSFDSSAGATQTVDVPVRGDTLDEPDETLSLLVETDGVDGPGTGSSDVGTGTIFDDDEPFGYGYGYGYGGGGGGGGGGPTPPGGSTGGGGGGGGGSSGCVDPIGPGGVLNPGCALPPPKLGETFNIERLSGEVTVATAPGQPQIQASRRARSAQKGRTFVPLVEPRQLTVGSFVNTRRGRVRITTAVDFTTATQFGNFSRGLFQVLQARRVNAPAVMRLKGSSFRRCRVRASGGLANAAQRRRLSSRTLRRLRSNANGNFRTRGKRSAATVRGTIWITADRCDGTLTRVRRGRVRVRDFRRRRTITVRAGKQYLARAPGA